MDDRLKAFLVHLDSLDESDGRENGFSREFNSIKKHLASVGDQSEMRAEAGRERANIRKNRYKDILPFDQTRVPLSLLLDEGYSDYINANFIRGIDGERYYIATQGPLGPTVVDFWRMIWEFSVKVIVMACREVELGKKKCERYWAAAEGTEVFGPFTITNVTEETLRKEVTIRTLSVSLLDDAETRSVSQFQYTAWPDHGIPQEFDCLLEMITRLHQRQGQLKAPICVHCSAGCGRTGVICTVDYVRSLLQRKLVGEGFSIQDIVQGMRRQRPAAVQTKDQYEFIYRIVGTMFRKELTMEEHEYENWMKDQRASQLQNVKQPLLSKDLTPMQPLSLPRKASRPQHPESMPKEGGAGETYAVVARQRGGGAAAAGPATESAPDYENLGRAGPSASQQLLYSTVIVKEHPQRPEAALAGYANRDPRSKAKETQSPRPGPSYATIAFGQPVVESRGSNPPAISAAADSEAWAPSLPERTADSYVIEDDDQPRASSFSSNEGKSSSKLRNVFKLVQGFPGSQGRKDCAVSTDDSYEDVRGLASPTLPTFSAANGLGFNCRISKPRGPRDPPEEWALYGR